MVRKQAALPEPYLMRLLLNPNTSASLTALLHAAGETAKAPGTMLVSITAPRKVA